jgi:hypothetical protein
MSDSMDNLIVEKMRKYIEANQYSKFVNAVKESGITFAHDIAGYKMMTDERMDYYVLAGQMDKIAPGIGSTRIAKAIDKAGFLVRDSSRTTLKYRFRPLVDNMRTEVLTYRISGDILTSE